MKQHIHFIGIGGIGMSSLALIAVQQGYSVSGCDRSLNESFKAMLQNAGCLIDSIDCSLNKTDIVVYSSAISMTHPELQRARKIVPLVLHRSMFLNMLIASARSIAVSGSHGKTTTTALIAHILEYAGYHPGFSIGGIAHNFATHGRSADQEWFVVEADESDRSLLNLSANIVLVTNIDYEHAETYTNLKDVESVFKLFLARVPADGLIVGCAESSSVLELMQDNIIPYITYGFNSSAMIQAYEIETDYSYISAKVIDTRSTSYLGTVKCPLKGKHNLLNALGALSVCMYIGVSFEQASKAITCFKGVARRFEYKGMLNNTLIYEDYGHHPEEIKNTLRVACRQAPVHLVFQPHRYSRTKALWKDFIALLAQSRLKSCIITDIYSAGEAPIEGINAQEMVRQLQQLDLDYPTFYLSCAQSYLSVHKKLLTLVKDKDIILLQGAGPLYKILDHKAP